MSVHLARARVLIQQSRYETAEEEIRQALAADPEDPEAHALLALCLMERKKYAEAGKEAERAVHLAPDAPFTHYVLALVLARRNLHAEAEAAIREALRLDPSNADYFALQANVRLARRNWPGALEAAEEGLGVDPEHVDCTNVRAMALVQLGRRDEAGATIDTALARDPDNSESHANMGWTLLHGGRRKEALEHFREALRLDPQNGWAREGIVEALKAGHFIYAVMLRYFLWSSRLSGRAQWAILLGGYFGVQALSKSGSPWALPIIILYLAFAIMTWIANPLFNLVLRLNRFGRHALSREQIVASNWIGACLFLALLSLGIWIGTQNDLAFVGARLFGFLLIPLSGTFIVHSGWPRVLMATVTGFLFFTLAWGAVWLLLELPLARGTVELLKASSELFTWGILIASFGTNALAQVRPAR